MPSPTPQSKTQAVRWLAQRLQWEQWLDNLRADHADVPEAEHERAA